MKKLFLVLGDCSNIRKSLTADFTLLAEECEGVIIPTHLLGPTLILQETLEKIRANLGHDNIQKILVVYAGLNMELLRDNLPGDSVDLNSFSLYLIKLVGGHETPQQKEMVHDLLFGGIKALLKR